MKRLPAVRRGYADTAAGQVHYRTAGEGDPVVLMHWAPSSGRQHLELITELAARRYQVFAPDLIGYGDSDKPDRLWSIADHATNLGQLLDAVRLDAAFLYGGHTTAAIAVEFACSSPTRVKALAMDGSPVLDAADRAARAGTYALPLRLEADGSHMLWAWKRSMRHPAMTLEETFADSLDLLKAGHWYHSGYEAVWAYDMGSRLPALQARVLAMTTPEDPLAEAHQRVLAAVPHCQEYLGPPRYSQTAAQRTARMAEVLDRFYRDEGPTN